jgi:hypothetical protein
MVIPKLAQSLLKACNQVIRIIISDTAVRQIDAVNH